jgi:hypothetical protein
MERELGVHPPDGPHDKCDLPGGWWLEREDGKLRVHGPGAVHHGLPSGWFTWYFGADGRKTLDPPSEMADRAMVVVGTGSHVLAVTLSGGVCFRTRR